MYPLFETIQIKDGRAKNLSCHQERLERSYEIYFGRKTEIKLKELLCIPMEFSDGLVKCRFSYGESNYVCEFENYNPKFIRTLKLVYVEDFDYSLKYTDRSGLNALLLQKEGKDDVLIVNNGQISDTSFSNIVFFNGNQWITPLQPLLEGTQRKRLLQEGIITEKQIRPEDLHGYRSFKLINAMLDFDKQDEIAMDCIHG